MTHKHASIGCVRLAFAFKLKLKLTFQISLAASTRSTVNEYKFNYADVKLIEWNLASICVCLFESSANCMHISGFYWEKISFRERFNWNTIHCKRPQFVVRVYVYIFLELLQAMHSIAGAKTATTTTTFQWIKHNERTKKKINEDEKTCQVVFTSSDTVNRKIKIIDDTIVISDIFGDNIVFYVHGSLKCATLSTNFELKKKQQTLFGPILTCTTTCPQMK